MPFTKKIAASDNYEQRNKRKDITKKLVNGYFAKKKKNGKLVSLEHGGEDTV